MGTTELLHLPMASQNKAGYVSVLLQAQGNATDCGLRGHFVSLTLYCLLASGSLHYADMHMCM